MSTETTPTEEPWDLASSVAWRVGELRGDTYLTVAGAIKQACLAYARQQTEALRTERDLLQAGCDVRAAELSRLLAQLTAARAALESARPLVKAWVVAQGGHTSRAEEAEAVLDQIEKALQ